MNIEYCWYSTAEAFDLPFHGFPIGVTEGVLLRSTQSTCPPRSIPATMKTKASPTCELVLAFSNTSCRGACLLQPFFRGVRTVLGQTHPPKSPRLWRAAYQEHRESTTSTTQSLRSSLVNYPIEHGRQYHAYKYGSRLRCVRSTSAEALADMSQPTVDQTMRCAGLYRSTCFIQLRLSNFTERARSS